MGRNLPTGEHLGAQIQALRKRRRLSQKELASLIKTTCPTLIRLEKDNNGRVETLEKALIALGAGAYIAEKGHKKAFYNHSGNSSVSQTWQTPKSFLDALYSVFDIDLDPCSPTINKRNAL